MADKGEDNSLNNKQEEFCNQYIIDSNGTQAAKRAGYGNPDNKETQESNLGAIASRLLRAVKIINRIAVLRGAKLDSSGYGSKDLLNEYKSLAHTNIVDFISDGVEVEEIGGVYTMKLEHFRRLPRSVTAAVRSVKTKPNGEVDFQLHDKLKAMEGLGKHFGIFEADNEQKNQLGINTKNLSEKELIVLSKLLAKASEDGA